MKRRYLVTFDVVYNKLDQTSPNMRAEKIVSSLRRLGGIILLNTQWAVHWSDDADALKERLCVNFGLNDRLTILEMSGDFSHYWTIESLNARAIDNSVEVERNENEACRWDGCSEEAIAGALFCEKHVQAPPSKVLPDWIRSLPIAIGTGLATSVLYDMLKAFADTCAFHDRTAERVDRILSQLNSTALSENSIEEMADFIEAISHDPSLQEDMQRALRNSATHKVG